MTSDFLWCKERCEIVCQINQFKVLLFYFDSFSNHYLNRVSSQQPKINRKVQIGSPIMMANSP